jgi:hypothetical protein
MGAGKFADQKKEILEGNFGNGEAVKTNEE